MSTWYQIVKKSRIVISFHFFVDGTKLKIPSEIKPPLPFSIHNEVILNALLQQCLQAVLIYAFVTQKSSWNGSWITIVPLQRSSTLLKKQNWHFLAMFGYFLRVRFWKVLIKDFEIQKSIWKGSWITIVPLQHSSNLLKKQNWHFLAMFGYFLRVRLWKVLIKDFEMQQSSWNGSWITIVPLQRSSTLLKKQNWHFLAMFGYFLCIRLWKVLIKAFVTQKLRWKESTDYNCSSTAIQHYWKLKSRI